MPCFSTAPDPGTKEYDLWVVDVRPKSEAFVHVVDYYFGKADEPIPHPANNDFETCENWNGLGERYLLETVAPANWSKVAVVIRQILLHLDCDDVSIFQLNEIRNFLILGPNATDLKNIGYRWISEQCFLAMRNNEV